MATMTVYQYDYVDRVLKRDRRSEDYATAEAISTMGGTVLAETAREVEEDLVDDSGKVRPADLPPRDLSWHHAPYPQAPHP